MTNCVDGARNDAIISVRNDAAIPLTVVKVLGLGLGLVT